MGFSSSLVGAPAVRAHPGSRGGDGEPGPPPRLTQQDLAQVRLLPWPWLKSVQKDRRSGTFSRTFYRRSSERKRKGRADSASASSVV